MSSSNDEGRSAPDAYGVLTLTANDEEPPVGAMVRDAFGKAWVHLWASYGRSYWLRYDALSGDPESWVKVAGNYGPVTYRPPR